jgi:hypothetical protein
MRKNLLILDSWMPATLRDLKIALYSTSDPFLYGRNALFMSRNVAQMKLMKKIEEKARHKKKSYVALGRGSFPTNSITPLNAVAGSSRDSKFFKENGERVACFDMEVARSGQINGKTRFHL